MSVDPGIAAWLKEGSLISVASDTAVATAFPDAIQSEIISPLALSGAADNEAGRQLAFLKGPLAIDTVNVAGLLIDRIGTTVKITANRLGYAAGLLVYVLGAEEDREAERTTLTVLRRL